MTFASFDLTQPRESQPPNTELVPRYDSTNHPGKLAGVEPWMYAGARRQIEILMQIAMKEQRK